MDYFSYKNPDGTNRNLYAADHGGDCCGRRHLSEFNYDGPYKAIVGAVKNALNEGFENYDEDYINYSDMCHEVTLTEEQALTVSVHKGCEGKTWDQVLTEELGFKRVFKFRNPNTSNVVFVYLHSDSEVL